MRRGAHRRHRRDPATGIGLERHLRRRPVDAPVLAATAEQRAPRSAHVKKVDAALIRCQGHLCLFIYAGGQQRPDIPPRRRLHARAGEVEVAFPIHPRPQQVAVVIGEGARALVLGPGVHLRRSQPPHAHVPVVHRHPHVRPGDTAPLCRKQCRCQRKHRLSSLYPARARSSRQGARTQRKRSRGSCRLGVRQLPEQGWTHGCAPVRWCPPA